MTRAHADSVESRRGREPDPRWKKLRGKFALPQSLDSWAIRTRLVDGHRSAETNERFEMLQGELRAARAFAYGCVRITSGLLSRRIVAEPRRSLADNVARILDDSRAA